MECNERRGLWWNGSFYRDEPISLRTCSAAARALSNQIRHKFLPPPRPLTPHPTRPPHLAPHSTDHTRAVLPTPTPMSAASTSTATHLLLLPRPAAPSRGPRYPSLLFSRRGRRLRCVFDASAVAGGSVSGGGAAREPPRTLFPGGFKRPEIQVPALVLRVGAEEALRSGDQVAAAIARGVGIVVLEIGEESGRRAYEAALTLKAAVGDRAYLLIAERVDVAAAVGASGVVIADEGWWSPSPYASFCVST
jgi:hypothetical protein